jgi:hypothetical protein
MNLKAKGYEQAHKQAAEKKLTALMAKLKEKGWDDDTLAKNTQVKKIRAEIRRANRRLKAVAAQEKLNAEKLQTKAEKLAVKKQAGQAPQEGKHKKAAGKPLKKEKRKA